MLVVLCDAAGKGSVGCRLDEGRIHSPPAGSTRNGSNVVGISTLSLGGEDGTGNISFVILSLPDRLVAMHVFDPSGARSFVTFVVVTAVAVVSHRLDVVSNSISDFRQVSFRQERRR